MNISSDWEPVGDFSNATSVYGDNVDGNVIKVGEVEQSSKLYKNVSVNYDEWALTQKGFQLPACDHNYGNEWWGNHWTEQTQTWRRSDGYNVDHIDHTPYNDKEASFDTSITASASGSASVTLDYKIPHIDRDVNYTLDEKHQVIYNYPVNYSFGQEGRWNDCRHHQIGIWQVDGISDGDDVVPTYYYGRFKNYADNLPTSGDSLFTFLEFDSSEL